MAELPGRLANLFVSPSVKSQNSPKSQESNPGYNSKRETQSAISMEGKTKPRMDTPPFVLPKTVAHRGIPKKGAHPLIASNKKDDHVASLRAAIGLTNILSPESADSFRLGTHLRQGTLVDTEFLVDNCPNDIMQKAFAVVRAQIRGNYNAISFASFGTTAGYRWDDAPQLAIRPHSTRTSFNVSGRFERMSLTPVCKWDIFFDPSYIEKWTTPRELEAHVSDCGGSSNIRYLLMSHYKMSKTTASALSRHIKVASNKGDNAALYCYIMLNVIQLHDYSKAGFLPASVGMIAGSFEIRDFAVPSVENNIIRDLDENRLVIDATIMGEVEISILRSVASGFPRWKAPPNCGGLTPHHILETLRAPPIPMALHILNAYDIAPPPTRPYEYWGLALKLASYRGEVPDMIRGLTRAMTIANGRIQSRKAVPTHDVFETCLLERYQIHMPAPYETNFMWALLGIQINAGQPTQYSGSEDASLYSINIDEVIEYGVGLCGALSSCAGTVLHNYNLGGEDLSAAVGNKSSCGDLPAMVSALMVRKHTMGEPIFFRMVISVLMKITYVKVNPSAFRCSSWSGVARSIPYPTDRNEEWGGTYSWRIPYQVDPLSMLYIYRTLPPFWGVTGQGPVVDISQGIIQSNLQGKIPEWIDSCNCPAYEMRARSRTCQLIVSHGILVLNAICQHFNWTTFSYNMVVLDILSDGSVSPILRYASNPFTPTLYEGAAVLKIGSYRTYSWQDHTVLSPMVQNLPRAVRLARGPMELYHAGLAVLNFPVTSNNFIFGRALPFLVGFDDDDDDDDDNDGCPPSFRISFNKLQRT